MFCNRRYLNGSSSNLQLSIQSILSCLCIFNLSKLNKAKTFALSCLQIKGQLHKLHSTKWFKKLSKLHFCHVKV
uniref:RNA-binding protein 39-like n=1 Tax=Rhizophora mucronata TaxID=61149 RepID=A0A2P2LEJ8_RHIMU